MVELPKELVASLKDPETVKVLTTVDAAGNPHSVFKASLTALDSGYLAYMEMLEFSDSTKNLLRDMYTNRQISIAVWDKANQISYQIKGAPYRFVYEGPIWDAFLEETWKMFPDSNPPGVWLIEPREVINEDYASRRKDLEAAYPGHKVFFTYMGVRK